MAKRKIKASIEASHRLEPDPLASLARCVGIVIEDAQPAPRESPWLYVARLYMHRDPVPVFEERAFACVRIVQHVLAHQGQYERAAARALDVRANVQPLCDVLDISLNSYDFARKCNTDPLVVDAVIAGKVSLRHAARRVMKVIEWRRHELISLASRDEVMTHLEEYERRKKQRSLYE